jgi:hypothetical protein
MRMWQSGEFRIPVGHILRGIKYRGSHTAGALEGGKPHRLVHPGDRGAGAAAAVGASAGGGRNLTFEMS